MGTKKVKEVIKAKEVKPKKEKVVKVSAPKYELISYEVMATIPTQMYGNIMPKIAIKAKTLEEAREILLPAIESLYTTYAERPRDGSALSFGSKANVTAVEKKVDVTPAPAPAPAKKPEGVLAGATNTPQETVEELASDLSKSLAFTKAENAVKNCTSREALNMIEDQIQKSVKLTDSEKPVLLTEVLKKMKEFEL